MGGSSSRLQAAIRKGDVVELEAVIEADDVSVNGADCVRGPSTSNCGDVVKHGVSL